MQIAWSSSVKHSREQSKRYFLKKKRKCRNSESLKRCKVTDFARLPGNVSEPEEQFKEVVSGERSGAFGADQQPCRGDGSTPTTVGAAVAPRLQRGAGVIARV
jgi:hypothetical protein